MCLIQSRQLTGIKNFMNQLSKRVEKCLFFLSNLKIPLQFKFIGRQREGGKISPEGNGFTFFEIMHLSPNT